MKYFLRNISIINIMIAPILFSCASNAIPSPHVHSALQTNFLNSDPSRIEEFAKGNEELSHPDTSVIKIDKPIGNNNTYILDIKTSEGLDHRVFTTNTNTFNFTNLMINSCYVYNIKCNNQIIQEGEFKTEDSIIRNLYVDGVTNVRDMGGYKTIDNKTVNQGLIYRSAALTNYSNQPLITNIGKATMLNDFKIKTEIDLRDEIPSDTSTSVLGNSVNYHNIRMNWNWSGTNQLVNLRNLVLEVFHIFSNTSNYPIDFHCMIGTDRTGIVGFILGCLLGLNEHDLCCDYLFSNFGKIDEYRPYNYFYKYFISGLSSFTGNNLKEKAIDYLTKDITTDLYDNPLTNIEINTIRTIMLKD